MKAGVGTAAFVIMVAVMGDILITDDLLLVVCQCACSAAGQGHMSFRKGGVHTSSRIP